MNVYTTDEDDSPGKGLDCVQFTSGTKTFTSVTKGLDIDASACGIPGSPCHCCRIKEPSLGGRWQNRLFGAGFDG